MSKPSFAVIGLAVMGENLALNVERNGFPVVVYNRTRAKTEQFIQGRAQGKQITPAYSLPELVQLMERPRKILIMVKAGPPVDAIIDELKPLLEPGDILIDGGNSLYSDTDRRAEVLEASGIHFVGMGVSGGEEGALNGPSLMPGGSLEAYRQLEPILTKIAAQVPDGPCVTYLGPKGGGHYVKMVHNGIEYGDMQLIAEAYDLMRRGLKLSAPQMQEIFQAWNETELESFLIEITAKILGTLDPETGKPLVDLILDKAGQKGTGLWTVKDALDLGVNIFRLDL
jgi:6-phosphogluconate dehydrogenase